MSGLRSVRDARLDPRLGARIVSRKPLRYRGGADAALDRPAHVRAASALCWVGGELIVLQDDAAFVGIVEAESGQVEDVPMPMVVPVDAGGRRVFDARQGNKADKPDFELAFGVGGERGGEAGTLIALGSGGLAARQRALRWRRGEEPVLVALPRLYELLRRAVVSEANLNFEGAALRRGGAQLVLANRGGDGGVDGSPDALVRMRLAKLLAMLDDPEGAALPGLQVTEVALGVLEDAAGRGHPLRFTDLSPRGDARDGLWYLAAAEQTESFYDDGDVVGSVLGVIDFASGVPDAGDAGEPEDEMPSELRFTPIYNERGEVGGDKVEGVCAHARADRLWAVTDPDDPERAGELLEIEIAGPW